MDDRTMSVPSDALHHRTAHGELLRHSYKIPVLYASKQQNYSEVLAEREYEISGEYHLPRWNIFHPSEELNKVRTWHRSLRNAVKSTMNPCDSWVLR